MIDAATRGEFDVVVMQAQDRFSRSDDGWSELIALAKHVEVWFYSDGRAFVTGTLSSNLEGFMRGEFRRAIALKTREKMINKAKLGHVTGGKVFGYDNMRRHGYVERVINPAEAKVVKDIFQRYADGAGFKQIAHALNAKKLPSPRPQRGRPQGWESSTVRAVLKRDLYRGVIVYNKTTKRDASGSASPDGDRFEGQRLGNTVFRPNEQVTHVSGMDPLRVAFLMPARDLDAPLRQDVFGV